MLPISKGYHLHPNWKGQLFRRTFPQLEEYIIPRSKELFKKLGGVYNETKHVWKFPSGATYTFGFIDKDDDAHDHDGASWNYLAFDELTHFTKYMYTYLIARVRSGTKELPAIVRSASNPGNIGHSWVRERFIEPCREGHVPIFDQASNTYRIFIPSKISDNPKLLEANPNYINQLMLLPEAERKPKMDGDWWAFSGQVFSEFRERRIPNEPENALHCIDSFPIPSFWPKIVGIDWGYTHKTAVYWSAISPDGRVFTYREYTCEKKAIDEWGADVGRLSKMDDNIVLVVMDPSAWKTESHGKRIVDQFIEASGMEFVEQAINDRIAGKLNMHNMLRWKQRPPKYVPKEGYKLDVEMRLYRLYGEKASIQYREMFMPEKPETNIPRWQIFRDECPELIKTIPLLVYDETRTEDVAKFDGDDSYDAIRYDLAGVDLYIRECLEKDQKLRKIQNVVQKYQQNGDYNAFHRRMEKLESDSRSKVVPINFQKLRQKRRVYRAS